MLSRRRSRRRRPGAAASARFPSAPGNDPAGGHWCRGAERILVSASMASQLEVGELAPPPLLGPGTRARRARVPALEADRGRRRGSRESPCPPPASHPRLRARPPGRRASAGRRPGRAARSRTPRANPPASSIPASRPPPPSRPDAGIAPGFGPGSAIPGSGRSERRRAPALSAPAAGVFEIVSPGLPASAGILGGLLDPDPGGMGMIERDARVRPVSRLRRAAGIGPRERSIGPRRRRRLAGATNSVRGAITIPKRSGIAASVCLRSPVSGHQNSSPSLWITQSAPSSWVRRPIFVRPSVQAWFIGPGKCSSFTRPARS